MSATLDNELSRLRIDRSRKGRPRRKRARWILLAILMAALAGGYLYYRHTIAPVPVKTVRAEREEAAPDAGEPVLTAGGYVIPRRRVEVASKIIGRVKEIRVDRGDMVQAGDVLIRLEDEEYEAQVNVAEAQLAASEAFLAELRAGSRPEEKAAARAAVAAAEASLEGSRRDLERFRALETGAVISRQELDRAQTAYEVARANWDSVRKNADLVEIGPRREAIQAAEAQVRQARANLEFARTQLAFTVIEAPIAGTILEKVAEQGELVTNVNFGGTRGARSSVVTMADLTDLQVEIDLNESELGKVRLGQPCSIRLDSLPGELFQGRVDEIAPQADRQKGTVQVKVAILDPSAEARPEVNAQVTFLSEAPAGAAPGAETPKPRVWIPSAALVAGPDGPMVFIAAGDVAVARGVSPSVEGPKGVEIKDGLAGNEMLILEPLEKMADGRRIRSEP